MGCTISLEEQEYGKIYKILHRLDALPIGLMLPIGKKNARIFQCGHLFKLC